MLRIPRKTRGLLDLEKERERETTRHVRKKRESCNVDVQKGHYKRRTRKKKEKIIESHFCLCTVSNTYTHTQRWNLFFVLHWKASHVYETFGVLMVFFLPENIISLSYRSREKEIRVRERRTITKPKNKFWSKENVFFFIMYMKKERVASFFVCIYTNHVITFI